MRDLTATIRIQMEVHHKADRTARFVRGFFEHLETHSIRAAVLHGGDDGFEHELSDVDFVVDASAFAGLAKLVHEYCTRSGWLLCQVLRHETTAAYCVCSAADDPACVVALDGCSDYRRNESVLLRAEELLAGCRVLPWGGRGLAPQVELIYRFVKAAVKRKDAGMCEVEFAGYLPEDRDACGVWLYNRWRIQLEGWNAKALDGAFESLRNKTNRRPSLISPGSLRRIVSRVLRPSGLVVVTEPGKFAEAAANLERTFGRVHFRRCHKENGLRAAMLREVIASSLIMVPRRGILWWRLLPVDCLLLPAPGDDAAPQEVALARHLNERCIHREGLA